MTTSSFNKHAVKRRQENPPVQQQVPTTSTFPIPIVFEQSVWVRKRYSTVKTSPLYIEEDSLLPHIEFLVSSVTLLGGNVAWKPRPNSLLAIGQGLTRGLLPVTFFRSAQRRARFLTRPWKTKFHVSPRSLTCSDKIRQRICVNVYLRVGMPLLDLSNRKSCHSTRWSVTRLRWRRRNSWPVSLPAFARLLELSAKMA